MELILWRHAEAEDGTPDLARALTSKGHKQAEKMADWLRGRLPSHTHILASPATRTQQTAHALGREFTTLDGLAPGVAPEDILRIAGWPDECESVLIIGHQPTLGLAAGMALLGREAPFSLKKGGLWWISQTSPDSPPFLRAALTPEML